MKAILLIVFSALGGVGLVFGLAGKFLPDLTANGLTWLFNKFPKLKQAVHDNLSALEALEQAEFDAVKKVEEAA